MTFEVVIEQDAEADLRSIADYLAEHYSYETATEFITAILDRIADLDHFPMRGVVPRETEQMGRQHHRQILFGRYRILYRVDAVQVTIVLVADGRRDMAALLRDRLLGHGSRA